MFCSDSLEHQHWLVLDLQGPPPVHPNENKHNYFKGGSKTFCCLGSWLTFSKSWFNLHFCSLSGSDELQSGCGN